MKILLINTNPVVSRLLALCTRDAQMELDEVRSLEAVRETRYDVVFVDDASYEAMKASSFHTLGARKKVLLSFLAELPKGFDEVIKKPFLPSQILQVLAGVDMTKDEDDSLETFSTKVLNLDEITRIKGLLETQEEEIGLPEDDFLEDESYEARKIQVIKEDLMAQGLEILEEDEMVEALSVSVNEDSLKLEKKLKKIKKRHKKKSQDYAEESIDIEAVLSNIITNLKPKKIQKLLNGEEIKIQLKIEERF